MKSPDQRTYGEMTKKASPPSPLLKNCSMAFIFGGTICTTGQLLYNFFTKMGLEEDPARAWVSISLITMAFILTAAGVYDNLARYGGAGTLVPITGFANSMVSPAMEFRAEGYVMGVGAKMLIISGPVIVYGTLASVCSGFAYYIMQMIG